jgi:hypothetical protein
VLDTPFTALLTSYSKSLSREDATGALFRRDSLRFSGATAASGEAIRSTDDLMKRLAGQILLNTGRKSGGGGSLWRGSGVGGIWNRTRVLKTFRNLWN